MNTSGRRIPFNIYRFEQLWPSISQYTFSYSITFQASSIQLNNIIWRDSRYIGGNSTCILFVIFRLYLSISCSNKSCEAQLKIMANILIKHPILDMADFLMKLWDFIIRSWSFPTLSQLTTPHHWQSEDTKQIVRRLWGHWRWLQGPPPRGSCSGRRQSFPRSLAENKAHSSEKYNISAER